MILNMMYCIALPSSAALLYKQTQLSLLQDIELYLPRNRPDQDTYSTIYLPSLLHQRPPTTMLSANQLIRRICLPIFVLLGLSTCLSRVSAFSAPNANVNSPWKAASWQFVLNIGRESSTTLPEEWGKSGARLFLPVELLAESDRLPDAQQDPLLGRGSNRLSVVEEAAVTYVTENGEQSVPILSGGWKLRLGRKKGHASLLRFWLDVGSSSSGDGNIVAQKNDVTLQANERLYFAALCWRQAEYALGRQKLQPLLEAYERSQSKIEQQVDHDQGDRRLDGTDALETLAAYKDMAGLTLDRDDKRRQLQEAQEYLPPPEPLQFGNWPGSTELMAMKTMEVFVQRRKGIFPGEDYHLIGTWKAKPLNVIPDEKEEVGAPIDDDADDDEEYEYYDEDEEDESDVDEYEYYYEEDGEISNNPSEETDFELKSDGPIQRPNIDQ